MKYLLNVSKFTGAEFQDLMGAVGEYDKDCSILIYRTDHAHYKSFYGLRANLTEEALLMLKLTFGVGTEDVNSKIWS